METINELHEHAMDLAQKAFLAKVQKDFYTFRILSSEAYELERKAAEKFNAECKDDVNCEPSRSILFKSAAFLAFHSGKYLESKKMIYETMIGDPDDVIREEMKDLANLVEIELNKSPNQNSDGNKNKHPFPIESATLDKSIFNKNLA